MVGQGGFEPLLLPIMSRLLYRLSYWPRHATMLPVALVLRSLPLGTQPGGTLITSLCLAAEGGMWTLTASELNRCV